MSLSKKKDILEELRNMLTATFMSKKWDPVIANRHGINLTVVDLIPLIQRSSRVCTTMNKITQISNVPMLELQRTIRTCLEELGHHRNMGAIRWVGMAICHILKKNYTGIIVNEESIERVKANLGANGVIFAPSHRSYADFILISFICFYYNIEIPVIAAGQDFQSMWVMGRILQECCAFFIRRTFGGDNLYKAVIAEYVSLLIECSHSALEFFIEGTRSRSGKSLVPKFGLMTMALEPYFCGKVPDVTVVPINITYERCLEDSLFARELLGIPKPKESTMLLLRALKVLKENYGRIYVEFGKPISVNKFCAQVISNTDPRIDLNQASIFSRELTYPGPQVSLLVSNLSFSVVREQNRLLTFLPAHIVAVSVSVWHVFDNRVPREKVETDAEYLQDILVELGYSVVVRESIEKEVTEALKLHSRVMYLHEKEKIIQLHFDLAPNYLQGSKLTEETVAKAYPAILVQQYANPVCLACIHICILNFVVCTATKTKEYTKNSLLEDYVFYRSILQVEFVLYMQDAGLIKNDFEDALEHMCSLNLFFTATMDKETIDLSNLEAPRKRDEKALLLGLLHPFLTGYALILKVLLAMTSELRDRSEKELKFFLQEKLEDEMSNNMQIPKYILSMELIGNALSAYTKMGALQRLQVGDSIMVQPNMSKCRYIQHDLELRLERLQYLMEASYQRFNYDHCSKLKLYQCKL